MSRRLLIQGLKSSRFWRFFSSIRLAIWLLVVIAAVSLIGTFIPQNESLEFYLERFGSAGYSLLSKTGLVNIYSAWWFILLLLLFSLNLLVCVVNRLPLTTRSMGTFMSHLGILIIFAGALFGIICGQKTLIRISEGEEVDSFMSRGKKVNLGFSVRLDDFIYTEHTDPKERLLVYPAKDSGAGPIAEVSTDAGVESAIADTDYKIKVLRYLPDFVIDVATKTAVSRSALPNNPAIEVRLRDRAGDASTFWVFARFPDMHQKMDPNFKFVYHWVGRRPKDFISKVSILKDGKEMLKKEIRVNEPLSYGGYKFFQTTYDTETLSWSGLQVVKDPSVAVVYAGFALLITGLAVIFYVNPLIQRR